MGNKRIIKNAAVIDPNSGTSQVRDLYIADGKLTDAFDAQGVPALDATGCYAAPGFVDSHVHVFEKHAAVAVFADAVGVEQGVLTVVDAGSTGIRDFAVFEDTVIKTSKTDVRFFLNIARVGLCDGLSELSDMDNLMTAEELASFQKEHGAQMVGLKVRMSGSVVKQNGAKPLAYARTLAEKSGLPIMVHIGNAPPDLGEVLNLLQKGDIVTHCFQGKPGGVPYYPEEFKAAVERGVHFDLGHGSASFSVEALPKVLDICPIDFTISTDLYSKNYETPVGSLMTTMSKLLHKGYSIEDLVRRVTALPRSYLGLPAAGVTAGEAANLTLFRIIEQPRTLLDSEGVAIQAEKYISPVASIKQGEQVFLSEL